MVLSLHLCVLWMILFHGAKSKDVEFYGDNSYGKIVKGIYVNLLPQIRTYEANIPISFVLELPQLQTSIPKFDCTAKSYLCQMIDHTVKIRHSILEEVVQMHPYLKQNSTAIGKGRQERGLINAIGYTQKFLYGTAMNSDVDKLHVGVTFINNQQQALQNAFVDSQKSLAQSLENINAYSTKMKSVIENEFKEVHKKFEEIADTTEANEGALAQISSYNMVNQYLLYVTRTLNEVAADCRNQLIPRTVLTTSMVESRLKSVEAVLLDHNWELVTDSNGLWKMPITDCSFSNNQLQVNIHVPIRRKGHKYKIYEVIEVPFQFNEYQCTMIGATPFVAKFGDNVIPISPHLHQFCKPEEKTFCLLPQYEKDSTTFSSCAAAVFGGKAEDITKECIFKCSKSNLTRVTEVAQGKVAVTNAKWIEFICDNEDKVRKYDVQHNVGALLIRLSCHCKVVVNGDGTKILTPPFPCKVNMDEMGVTQIIPTTMSMLRGVVLEEAEAPVSKLREIIDFQWHTKIPVLNLTAPEPYIPKSSLGFGEWMDIHDETSSIVYLWLICLTVAFVILAYISLCGHQRMIQVWNPVSLMGMILLLPCALTQETSEVTIGKAAWQLLQIIEIENAVIIAVGTVFTIIALVFTCKIFRYIKQTYHYTKSLVMDVEMGSRRR